MVKNFFFYLMLLFSLAGCAREKEEIAQSLLSPSFPLESQNFIANGSIFQEKHSLDLFNTSHKWKIGDIIMVNFDESMNFNASVQDSMQKNNKSKVDLFGANPSLNLGGIELGLGNEAGSKQSFSGSAEASRSNRLTGLMSVTVKAILSNGNLIVAGERITRLSHSREKVQLAGLIRPEDVDQNNTILSHKVADAKIVIGGHGSFNDSSKPTALYQLLARYNPI